MVRKHGVLSTILPAPVKTETPAQTKQNLSIDYPQEGERVNPGHYSIRVSAIGEQTQVSIDNGTWQNCRQDSGYDWYDWNPEGTGTHRITARTRVNNAWVKTNRTCQVG